MLKILFIGDPHFKISNMEEIDIYIDKIINLVKLTSIDFCIIAGDLLHTHERLNSMVLNKAVFFVEQLSLIVKTYIIIGNHDMYNNKQFLTNGHWMNFMKQWNNVIIIDRVLVETINGVKVVFVPYVQPGLFEKALGTIDGPKDGVDRSAAGSEWKDASRIFAHQEFYGCKMGSIVSSEGDKWDLDYPEIISGHIHDKQRPQPNIYYPGSSMQQSYSDKADNIIVLLDIINGEKNAIVKEIDLELCKKRIIKIKCKDFYTYDFKNIINSTDKIKLTLSGTIEEYKELRNTSLYKEMSIKLFIVFKKNEVQVIRNLNSIEKKDFKYCLKQSVDKENNIYLNNTLKMLLSGP